MKDDYGYFGKGIEGYVHYMQAVNESGAEQTGKTTSKNSSIKKAPAGGGFFSMIIQVILAIIMIWFIVEVIICY